MTCGHMHEVLATRSPSLDFQSFYSGLVIYTWLTTHVVFTLQRLSCYHTAQDHIINHIITRDGPGGPRFPVNKYTFIKQDISSCRSYLPEAQSKYQTSNNYMLSVYLRLLERCVFNKLLISVQFSHSVVSDSLWPYESHSTPGLPVHHQLPEFTQTHVHQVGDAIQPSHPL